MEPTELSSTATKKKIEETEDLRMNRDHADHST